MGRKPHELEKVNSDESFTSTSDSEFQDSEEKEEKSFFYDKRKTHHEKPEGISDRKL